MVSKQVDYAESDKLISFYVRESWKILNFNYVSYHCNHGHHLFDAPKKQFWRKQKTLIWMLKLMPRMMQQLFPLLRIPYLQLSVMKMVKRMIFGCWLCMTTRKLKKTKEGLTLFRWKCPHQIFSDEICLFLE